MKHSTNLLRLVGIVVFLVLVCSTNGPLRAEGAASAPAHSAGLTWIDWLIIVFYGASTIGLGWWFGRNQSTTKEYFVGSGNMSPTLIGVSLFATLLSTITYLSMPGEVLGKGPVYLTNLLAYPFIFVIVGYVLLPVYMRYRVTSAYELLESKLGLSLRMLGVVMFLSLRFLWMSLLVFLAAKAMTTMLGVSSTWIPAIVLATGVVAITYTTLGGLRAVVITDLIQTILLFGGALLVIATITVDFGGFGWFPTQWNPTWDTQPIFSFDPGTRVTVVGTILTVMTWYICTAGGDQVSVQRFMATKDARAARRAFATQLTVGATVSVTLGMVGFALLGYFKAHPELLQNNIDLANNADEVFPHFIAFHLPPGVSGLVVAAMFAAAMSSIDSGVNSITAVVMTDLLDRFGLKPKTERGHIRFARCLAIAIGLIVVIGSLFAGRVEGNITAVTSKTVNLCVTPIFSLFFFALFVPFAKPVGVWMGAICGTITAAVFAFSGSLVYLLHTRFQIDPAVFGSKIISGVDSLTGEQYFTAEDPISFQWIGPCALLVNISIGLLVSWMCRGSTHSNTI